MVVGWLCSCFVFKNELLSSVKVEFLFHSPLPSSLDLSNPTATRTYKHGFPPLSHSWRCVYCGACHCGFDALPDHHPPRRHDVDFSQPQCRSSEPRRCQRRPDYFPDWPGSGLSLLVPFLTAHSLTPRSTFSAALTLSAHLSSSCTRGWLERLRFQPGLTLMWSTMASMRYDFSTYTF